MNCYYTEAGQKLAHKMNETWTASNVFKECTSSFEFKFIAESRVKRLVSEIKISKSSAIANLGSRILKDAFIVLALELTHLYNVCIDTIMSFQEVRF